MTSSKKEDLKDVKNGAMTQTERDREWNLKNSSAGYEQVEYHLLAVKFFWAVDAISLKSIIIKTGTSSSFVVKKKIYQIAT